MAVIGGGAQTEALGLVRTELVRRGLIQWPCPLDT
jgi:hypothetical protein